MLAPLLAVCVLLAVSVAESEVADPTAVSGAAGHKTTPISSTNTPRPTDSRALANFTLNALDSSMIQRTLYVLIGITIITVLYFLVRAVRLKKTTQKKKYGLLSNYDETVELAHLESDEEDTTVYEAKSLRR